MGRSRHTELFPLFRSDAQGRVLAAVLFGGPAYVSAIAEAAKLPVSTAHREITRLERSGLLMSTRVGRQRVVAENRESPYLEDVRSIVMKTYGPPAIVAEELDSVDGIEEAHIFGSWAARVRDEAGESPRDIDLLVISWRDPTEVVDGVYAAAARAERRLELEVNPVVVGRAEWEAGDAGFLDRVKAGPRIRIS
jgi:predicted nucleotidyltransferase